MGIVALENLSDVEQYAWGSDNLRHSIQPKAIVSRPTEIAGLFLNQVGKYVRKYVPFSIPEIPGEPKLWVANVTGNPAIPKEVTFKYTNKKTGVEEWLKKPHPHAPPITISYRMQQGSAPAIDGEGKESSVNLPSVLIKFPSASRYPVSKSIANWLVNEMDAMQETDCVGRLVFCRGPSEFEPNDSWDYDDVRLYVSLMGSVPLDVKKVFPPSNQLKNGTDEKKEQLLNALFFYLIDAKYGLVPYGAFQAAKASRDAGKTPAKED